MSFLRIGRNWGSRHTGAVVGTLVLNQVAIPGSSAELDARRVEVETDLRARFRSRSELEELPILQHYKSYYKQFKKSYHVSLQLESVALKGKPIPSFNPLVTAMFMAELENMLLTAGHDLDKVTGKVSLDLAKGDESYTTIAGQQKTLKAGDMFTADEQGVLSSIVYGPDARTKIGPNTSKLLFVVYAPPGIGPEKVQTHLQQIADTIALFAPEMERGQIEAVRAE